MEQFRNIVVEDRAAASVRVIEGANRHFDTKNIRPHESIILESTSLRECYLLARDECQRWYEAGLGADYAVMANAFASEAGVWSQQPA